MEKWKIVAFSTCARFGKGYREVVIRILVTKIYYWVLSLKIVWIQWRLRYTRWKIHRRAKAIVQDMLDKKRVW
jgi:hypothetical protein